MTKFAQTIVKFSIIVLMLAMTPHSHANFTEAMRLYKANEFEKAYVMFKRMAEMGYFPAQYNLGVMYSMGQYVAKDPIQGYAWLKLAEGRVAVADDGINTVYVSFTDVQKKAADVAAEELAALYGTDTLSARLMPKPLADEDCVPESVPVSKTQPRYPPAALRKGVFGSVIVVFDVDDLGRTRNPSVLFGPEIFHEASLEAVDKFKYEPNKPSRGVMNRIVYEIRNVDKAHVQRQVDVFRKEADSGSAAAKYVYAVNVSYIDHFRPEHQVLNQYLVDAAQQGLREAQFMIGRNLLRGQGCEVDKPKGLAWLQQSAQLDYAPAQFLLANETADDPLKQDSSMVWLQNAADSKHYPSMLKLAWIYATSRDAKIRDPVLSLRLATEAAGEYSDKITGWDTLAAAYAANGNFKKAIRFQKKAIKLANRRDWSIPSLEDRLDTYQHDIAWLDG
ncbi:MAG: TonB family protein [Candidatus Azotimanducaceae bacterium]|jgi:TonB family protein